MLLIRLPTVQVFRNLVFSYVLIFFKPRNAQSFFASPCVFCIDSTPYKIESSREARAYASYNSHYFTSSNKYNHDHAFSDFISFGKNTDIFQVRDLEKVSYRTFNEMSIFLMLSVIIRRSTHTTRRRVNFF